MIEMVVTLEKIDIIIEKANVTYPQAKTALEKSEGDLVEALILLEKEEDIKNNKNREKAKKELSIFDRTKEYVKGILNKK